MNVGENHNWKVGDKLTHPKKPEWGIGEIFKLRNGKVEVHFADEGMKTFTLKHIRLTPLGKGQTALSHQHRQFTLIPSPYKDPTQLFSQEFWFTFPPAFKSMFRDGSLVQEWKDQFPLLFDQDDEEAALGHRGEKLHFFKEWLGAILTFHKFGHPCLCSNYTHNAHQSKNALMGALFDPETHQQIRDIILADGRQALPALLFYTPDFTHKYFVHVRDAWVDKYDYHKNREPTPLSSQQKKYYTWIRDTLKMEIKVINLQQEVEPTKLIM